MTDAYTRKTDVRVGDVRLPPRGRAFVVVTMNGSKVWCTVSDLLFQREREVSTRYVERCRLVMRDQIAPEREVLSLAGMPTLGRDGIHLKCRNGYPVAELYAWGLKRQFPRLRLAASQGQPVRITITIEPRKKP